MSRQAWRYQTLPQNTAKIKRFCQKYSFSVKELNNGYQLRIENVLDLYPVRAKYHNLTTHERGEWETMDDLRKIMLKALPRFDKQIDYNPAMIGRSEGFHEIGQQPQVMNVLSVPAPKRLWPRLILAKIRRFLHV